MTKQSGGVEEDALFKKKKKKKEDKSGAVWLYSLIFNLSLPRPSTLADPAWLYTKLIPAVSFFFIYCCRTQLFSSDFPLLPALLKHGEEDLCKTPRNPSQIHYSGCLCRSSDSYMPTLDSHVSLLSLFSLTLFFFFYSHLVNNSIFK